MPETIFISPHLDDAALSCGGIIFRLASRGIPVRVVTVCTAEAPDPLALSPVARRLHASWDAGDAPFATRCAEDRRAMTRLGASPLHLDLPDAMYRADESGVPHYGSALARVADNDRTRFVPRIVAALRSALADALPDALVVAPAGTGGHPDHVLVREAAEALGISGPLVYYDEYPYAAHGASSPPAGQPRTLPITSVELAARLAAVGEYTSQLRGLFPTALERWREVAAWRLPIVGPLLSRPTDIAASRSRMAEEVESYVALTGGEQFVWPADVASPFPEA